MEISLPTEPRLELPLSWLLELSPNPPVGPVARDDDDDDDDDDVCVWEREDMKAGATRGESIHKSSNKIDNNDDKSNNNNNNNNDSNDK
jgi:hypothetical protein